MCCSVIIFVQVRVGAHCWLARIKALAKCIFWLRLYNLGMIRCAVKCGYKMYSVFLLLIRVENECIVCIFIGICLVGCLVVLW